MCGFAVKMQRERRQKEVVDAIKGLGAVVWYDYKPGDSEVDLIHRHTAWNQCGSWSA